MLGKGRAGAGGAARGWAVCSRRRGCWRRRDEGIKGHARGCRATRRRVELLPDAKCAQMVGAVGGAEGHAAAIGGARQLDG